MDSLHKFYFSVWTLASSQNWRIGQALFNHLLNVRPTLQKQSGAPTKIHFTVRLPQMSDGTERSALSNPTGTSKDRWKTSSPESQRVSILGKPESRFFTASSVVSPPVIFPAARPFTPSPSKTITSLTPSKTFTSLTLLLSSSTRIESSLRGLKPLRPVL